MAREESDREDLLREATALVERVELAVAKQVGDTTRLGWPKSGSASGTEPSHASVVVGFRSNGAVSIFFNGDPVYQFNAAGELRRAFCDGRILKAVRGRLVSLERVRTPREVQLRSRELTDAEQRAFLSAMQERLRDLRARVDDGRFSVIGQVPRGADVIGRVRKWFAAHDGMAVAATAGV